MGVIGRVLVTGASTGIGRAVVEHLAAAGHHVYAGVRKECDLRALASLPNVQSLRLDITDRRDIEAVREELTASGLGLYGLVNNAGIASLGSLISGDENEIDLVMNVNVYGTYRVTRALAPLILASQGRVVTIGSISGVLAERNVGIYSMSKHALEAFTDALAEEMQPFAGHASIVEPGTFNTQLVKNAMARLDAAAAMPDLSGHRDPHEVAVAVELALFEPLPRRRYLVTADQDEARKTIRKQIEQLVQLNEGHSFTYDRDTLIRMLDEALHSVRPRNDVGSIGVRLRSSN